MWVCIGFCLREHTQHKHNNRAVSSLSLHLGFRLPLSFTQRRRRSSVTADPPSPPILPHRRSYLTVDPPPLQPLLPPSLSLTDDVDGCSPLTDTPPSLAILPHRRFQRLAEPSIRDAFGLCVQQGANSVIVSPFFLFPGRHWHQDIPSLTAEAAKGHPGVSYIITAPLGLHELLVDVMNDRIKYCLSHVAGDAGECSVCAGTGKCRVY
ncbi:hypothetical protein LOK49_LG01G00498 [Camellia lanceoleosa]|uniref:Uncharacterized protein n=1 Tax=Camellia lanceoleosa TaxID=1840588 RepID=A0ACC0IVP7_9ERIC|nr:hypothetical protein LOK49_LG01G00498 [Camellia lanceoleosa]